MNNINLLAPINTLSYGVVSTNVLKALAAQGMTVSLFPIGNIELDPLRVSKEVAVVEKAILASQTYDATAPSLRIYHQFALAEHVGHGEHIGWPIFELNKFTDREKTHLKNQERLIVCSQWAKDVVIANIGAVNPIHVVPLGVDREVFHENHPVQDSETTVFLSVGKWEKRKGHEFLIDCFNSAFNAFDNVALWMVPENPFISVESSKQWRDLATFSPIGDKIVLMPRTSSQTQLAELMSFADCGVFPARAEGWNLPLLEMMSLGKQVIATNYSAHTEFCDDANSMLIPIDSLEPAFDEPFFRGQGEWATLGNDQKKLMVEYMRVVHETKQAGRLTRNDAGIETAKQFSWERAARLLREAIND